MSDAEVVEVEPDELQEELAQQQQLDEEARTKSRGEEWRSWLMLVVSVGLLASVAAQEFTVQQYYNTFKNFAKLEDKSKLKDVLSWITGWAIPPYLAALQALVVTLPLLWLLETKGLRVTMNVLALLAVFGVGLKLLADQLELHYAVIYAGQMLINVCRIGMLPAAHRMAVAWFGARRISLVCAVVFFADNMGIMCGYLVPHLTYWLFNHDMAKFEPTIKSQYLTMNLAPVFFALLSFVTKDVPVVAPSAGEDVRRRTEPLDASFLAFLKRTYKIFADDFNLVLHAFSFALAFGITMMVFHPIRLTVLFEVQEDKYQDLDLPITTTCIFAGYAGAVLTGMLLDRVREHQALASAAYLLVFIFNITLSVSIHVKSTSAIFFAYGALSFAFSSYVVAALEYGAERGFPALESTVTGVLVSCGYLVGGAFSSYTGTHYLSIQDATLTGYIASALLSVGLLCTAGLQPTFLKRHNAGDDAVF